MGEKHGGGQVLMSTEFKKIESNPENKMWIGKNNLKQKERERESKPSKPSKPKYHVHHVSEQGQNTYFNSSVCCSWGSFVAVVDVSNVVFVVICVEISRGQQVECRKLGSGPLSHYRSVIMSQHH